MKLLLIILAAAAFVLLPFFAFGQAPGQYSFQQKNDGTGFTPRNVTPQNNKAFGIDSSGNLVMLSLTGSSTLAGLTDVAFSSLINGQLQRYNAASGDWENWSPDYLTAAAADAAYQPLNAELTSIAALTTTPFGLSLLTGADAADTRTTLLGLGTMATQQSSSVSITGGSISGLTSFAMGGSDGYRFLGLSGQVLTLKGFPSTGSLILNLPTTVASGSYLITTGDSATVTNAMLAGSIDLSTKVTGSLSLARIAQSGATSGQAIAWNGSGWAPATISATPGGSSGQVQINSGGSFAGISGITTAGSAVSALTIAGGTVTTSTPMISASQTWNAAGTAFDGVVIDITGTAYPAYSSTWSAIAKSFNVRIGGNTLFAVIPRGRESQPMLRLGGSDASHTFLKDGGAGNLIIGRNDGYDYVSIGWGGDGLFGVTGAAAARLGWNETSNNMSGGNAAPTTFFTRQALNVIQLDSDVNGNADDYVIKGPDGITGTDRSGGDVTIASGDSTGTGTSAVIISTPVAGSTGTAARTASEAARFDEKGLLINIGRLPTSAAGLTSGRVWRDGELLKIVP